MPRDARGLETTLRTTGSALQAALGDVLDDLPGGRRRPADLVHRLGVNRDIAGRTLQAVAATDPFEALHAVPGPAPLRLLLDAASREGVSRVRIEAALAAVDRFDALIRDLGGTRPGLDALVATRMPSVRDRHEQRSKQAVYRGMRQLRGACADTWLSATLLHPSSRDARRLDHVQVHGAIGLRLLRPDARVKFTYREFQGAGAASTSAGPPSAFDLTSFLRHPAAHLEAATVGQVVHYRLAEHAFGPRTARDVLVADHHAAALDRFAAPGSSARRGAFVCPPVPVETLLFDVLLHEDVFPGAEPELEVYDTGSDGAVNVNDPARAADRVDVNERVELLGRDPSRFAAPELPRYREMLAHLCTELGWDVRAFRGYRCRVRYPVPAWQVSLSFRPPEESLGGPATGRGQRRSDGAGQKRRSDGATKRRSGGAASA